MKARFFYAFLMLCLLAATCLLYGFFIEPKRLIMRDVSIQSSHYSGDPLKLVFITDIHIAGFHTPTERISQIVDKVNEVEADLILIGGDFIDGHIPRAKSSVEFNAEIEIGLDLIGTLRAKTNGAVYTVMGNHDNWYDPNFITQTLNQSGVHVLNNQGVMQGGLCVIGIEDFATGKPSSDGYKDCSTDAIKIAVTHSPDGFSYLSSDTALAVAGHTHGGQINLPLLGRRVTKTRSGKALAYGLKSVGETPVFISAGIGTSLMPARFRAPPEIVVINLSN